MDSVRITVAVARVLRQFVNNPTEQHYGYDLMKATGYASGKLYPILARLTAAGWLVKEVEDIDPEVEGRPPRRLYRLSPEGLSCARIELARLAQEIAPPEFKQGRPRLQGNVG